MSNQRTFLIHLICVRNDNFGHNVDSKEMIQVVVKKSGMRCKTLFLYVTFSIHTLEIKYDDSTRMLFFFPCLTVGHEIW